MEVSPQAVMAKNTSTLFAVFRPGRLGVTLPRFPKRDERQKKIRKAVHDEPTCPKATPLTEKTLTHGATETSEEILAWLLAENQSNGGLYVEIQYGRETSGESLRAGSTRTSYSRLLDQRGAKRGVPSTSALVSNAVRPTAAQLS